MALPLYLAMTAAELLANPSPPGQIGYMACHFSPYGTGISNMPHKLPEGSLLILNDRIPICGHDPDRIADQLSLLITQTGAEVLLLDFQTPEVDALFQLAAKLTADLPCPVGISSLYARELACPVFLPPVPLDTGLNDYLKPWTGREIWLEAATDAAVIYMTQAGYQYRPLPHPEAAYQHSDTALHCHYSIQASTEGAHFPLHRTAEDLQALLSDAEGCGVTRAIGLWQELGKYGI